MSLIPKRCFYSKYPWIGFHGYTRRYGHLFSIYFILYLFLFSILMYYQSLSSLKSSESQLPPLSSTRILYVVRTSAKFYDSRLKYLLQTWIALVNEHVYFVTDKIHPSIPNNHTIPTEEICGVEKHVMKTLCCKTAHDFVLFYKHQSKYDWLCHFDDDQYVNVNNLERYLSTLDFNYPYYIGRNSWSSAVSRLKRPFPYPFWFATLGAGVCLSKHLVHILRPLTEHVTDFVNGCIKENYHDDIYLGFIISAHLNVTLTKNLRFHSHLEKDMFTNKTRFLNTYNEQITFGFHYPDHYPAFLPNLYDSSLDPYHLRSFHCLLYTSIPECQERMRQYIVKTIFR